MTPFRFGPPERRLFGIFTAAVDRASARRSVLFVNPFGQEAIRCQRMLKVLAGRLASDGINVLRFDHYGTGDSDGEDESFSVGGAIRDVIAAHRELRRLAPLQPVMWLGIRLGATIAIQALQETAERIDRLVAWSPVLDGSTYLRALRAEHREAVATIFSARESESGAVDPLAQDEAVGFAVSKPLLKEFERLVPATVQAPADVDVRVLASLAETDAHAWAAAQSVAGSKVRSAPLEVGFDWISEEALNTALVPAAAIQRVRSELIDAA